MCECLYLDIMQEVFSQISKVLVIGQQGQNNLFYLLLDKMIDGCNVVFVMGVGVFVGGGSVSVFDLGLWIVNDLCQ